MQPLFIVIHMDDDDLIKQYFIDTFFTEQYVITKEYGIKDDNPHFHVILFTDKSINSIRNQLKRKFKVNLSVMVVRDLHKSLYYILKDGNVIHYNIYTQADIEQLQANLKTQQLEFENKILEQKQERKKKSLSYLQILISNYTPMEMPIHHDNYTNIKRDIINHVTDYVIKNFSKLANRHIIHDHCYSILIKVYPDQFLMQEHQSIADKLYNTMVEHY